MRARVGTALRLACLGVLLAAAAPEQPGGEAYGAPFELSEATPIAEVAREPERFAGTRVLVHGRISDVCQKKGCWTVLSDGEAVLRVRFADYAFFVPKDSAGSHAWAEGVVTLETLSQDEARHYAAESRNDDPDAVRGPQR